ncbi:MAG: hypothetical protein VXW65_14525 [Pseudomonadota bacterium]|nr:hypothetical protein [Pseudomonadota bacterium]
MKLSIFTSQELQDFAAGKSVERVLSNDAHELGDRFLVDGLSLRVVSVGNTTDALGGVIQQRVTLRAGEL